MGTKSGNARERSNQPQEFSATVSTAAAAVATDPAELPIPQDQTSTQTPALPIPVVSAAVAEIKVLRARIESLETIARAELQEQQDRIDKEFADLTSVYGTRTERPRRVTTTTRSSKPRSSKPQSERHCDICNVNGHDGRAHKKHPKKFSEAEMTKFATA